MVGGSVIRQSTRNAVRIIVFAAAAVAAVIALVLLERLYYGGLRDHVGDRASMALESARDLAKLHDEKALTAEILALSGKPELRDRLEALQQQFDARIVGVSPHAPLTLMERLAPVNASLARNYQGIALATLNERLASARALLSGADMAALQSERAGLLKQIQQVIGDDRARSLRLIDQVAATLLLAALAVIAMIAVVMAVRMRRSLMLSEAAFLEADERIRDLAAVDPLTGALSRGAFRQDVASLCAHAQRTGASMSIAIFDLDAFKSVSARIGYLRGDAVLRTAAARLRAQLRPGESLARMGGDVFAVAMLNRADDHKPLARAQELHRHLCGQYDLGDVSVTIGASVGVAAMSAHAPNADGVLRAASVAVRHAKSHAQGEVLEFHAATMDTLDERTAMTQALRAAIADGAIEPVFQPIVDLESGEVDSVEVLARWRDATLGAVAPDVFIPLAEEAGMIDDLLEGLLAKACEQAKEFAPHVAIVINAAPGQFIAPNFSQRIMHTLMAAQWSPSRLIVDVTETALAADFASARKAIMGLRAMGVRVALDDFGTGYSSLAYLSEMAFDTLKIDRAFVRTLQDAESSARIVAAIAGLGRSLNLTIVAEGVESARDAQMLAELGCQKAQGYYFARPMSAPEVSAYIARASEQMDAVQTPQRTAA